MSGIGMMLLGSGGDTVKITDVTITDTNLSPIAASSGYQLNASSAINKITSTLGTVPIGNWVVPASSASNYEAKATLTSGTLSTGTTGTWISCAASPGWYRNRTTVGTNTAIITVEIRLIGTTTTLTSASITLTSTQN
jgi:hypothetical protein